MPKLDPGSPGSNKIFSVRDPRSPGSHGYISVTGSKISRIPGENENIRSKIFQDLGSWILGIQDPGSFWDPGTCLSLDALLDCWASWPRRSHGCSALSLTTRRPPGRIRRKRPKTIDAAREAAIFEYDKHSVYAFFSCPSRSDGLATESTRL